MSPLFIPTVHLGAKKVIVTGRNPDNLKRLPSLGADVVIALGSEGNAVKDELKEQMAAGVDVEKGDGLTLRHFSRK